MNSYDSKFVQKKNGNSSTHICRTANACIEHTERIGRYYTLNIKIPRKVKYDSKLKKIKMI